MDVFWATPSAVARLRRLGNETAEHMLASVSRVACTCRHNNVSAVVSRPPCVPNDANARVRTGMDRTLHNNYAGAWSGLCFFLFAAKYYITHPNVWPSECHKILRRCSAYKKKHLITMRRPLPFCLVANNTDNTDSTTSAYAWKTHKHTWSNRLLRCSPPIAPVITSRTGGRARPRCRRMIHRERAPFRWSGPLVVAGVEGGGALLRGGGEKKHCLPACRSDRPRNAIVCVCKSERERER